MFKIYGYTHTHNGKSLKPFPSSPISPQKGPDITIKLINTSYKKHSQSETFICYR